MTLLKLGHTSPVESDHAGNQVGVIAFTRIQSSGPTHAGECSRGKGVVPRRPASQAILEKLTTALDDAHTARARLGNRGESDVIGPEDIDKLPEPAKRLAAWRRLISDTVESVTVAPAMTADGRPSHLWDPRRIDIRFRGQHP